MDVAYVLDGDTYSFELGTYDRQKELVIDPILATTFAGGFQDDIVEAIALDTSGNVTPLGTRTRPTSRGPVRDSSIRLLREAGKHSYSSWMRASARYSRQLSSVAPMSMKARV